MGLSVEREKEMDVKLTVGSVFNPPDVGPFLITNTPLGAGNSVNALTVFIGLSPDVAGSTENCFVLSSKVVDAVSPSECVPENSLIVVADAMWEKAVWISLHGRSFHPQVGRSSSPFVATKSVASPSLGL